MSRLERVGRWLLGAVLAILKLPLLVVGWTLCVVWVLLTEQLLNPFTRDRNGPPTTSVFQTVWQFLYGGAPRDD